MREAAAKGRRSLNAMTRRKSPRSRSQDIRPGGSTGSGTGFLSPYSENGFPSAPLSLKFPQPTNPFEGPCLRAPCSSIFPKKKLALTPAKEDRHRTPPLPSTPAPAGRETDESKPINPRLATAMEPAGKKRLAGPKPKTDPLPRPASGKARADLARRLFPGKTASEGRAGVAMSIFPRVRAVLAPARRSERRAVSSSRARTIPAAASTARPWPSRNVAACGIAVIENDRHHQRNRETQEGAEAKPGGASQHIRTIPDKKTRKTLSSYAGETVGETVPGCASSAKGNRARR